MFRRAGYETKDEAQADLDRLRGLVNLAEDDHDRDAIATMILDVGPKGKLPEIEETRRQLHAGQPLDDDSTVEEWLLRWHAQESHRRATEVSYESHVRLYLVPNIGRVRLRRLTVGHVIEMFISIGTDNEKIRANNAERHALTARVRATSKRSEKRELRKQLANLPPHRRPVEVSSQRRILATLRAALNDAIRQQLTTFNPAAMVELDDRKVRALIWTPARVDEWKRTGARPGPVMVWTPEQAGIFLDYVAENDPDYEAMWHLAILRGPRRGELAGLGWVDTNLDAANLQIRTQLTEVEYKIEEGTPKSVAGERTISLDKEGVELLRAHRRHQWSERERLGPDLWVESGRVFTQADGSALRPSWITDRFERLYKAVGLPPIRLHDLRHTAATLMLAAGVDMKVIQETLGHAALSTTSDIYTSVLPHVAADAAEATVAVVPRRGPRALDARPPRRAPGETIDQPSINPGAVRPGRRRVV